MELTPEMEFNFGLFKKAGRRLPRFDSTAQKYGISEADAKSVLDQYRAKHKLRVRGVELPFEEPVKEAPKKEHKPVPTMESLVIKFSTKLQYFGFIVATIVDVALAWFFFYSLGSGDLAKIMLGLMGLVLTAAKTWGWAYSKIDRKAIPVAIFAVALSIFGNTAIFRAEIELQAKTALSTNSAQTSKQSPESVLQGKISDKQAELKLKVANRDAVDATVEANLPMYNTWDNKVKAANKELAELTARLETLQKAPVVAVVVAPVEKTEIQLDAWSVFRQWTELDLGDHPRALAYFFTLIFACLPELVIFATTPRKVREEEGKE